MKVVIDKQCKLCNHVFSHKYNLKRHLEENLCKKANELNLYEIYLIFSCNDKITKNQETQTERNKYKHVYIQTDTFKNHSVSIQTGREPAPESNKIKTINTYTQTECETKIKTATIATQTKFDDVNTDAELGTIEKINYDFIKFNDIRSCIEKYKYDTKLIYISKILQLIFCNIHYKENQAIKYLKSYPATFVFLSNIPQNNYEKTQKVYLQNETKYLHMAAIGCVIEYIYPYIKDILYNVYKNIVRDCKRNHDWEDWYDLNKDEIKNFTTDLKNENLLKNAIKYFLKNVLLNEKTLKYKI